MTLLTDNQFIQMRDSGKFSTTFKGVHTVFVYVGSKYKNKNVEKNVEKLTVQVNTGKYNESPPAPRYRPKITIFMDKYFNKMYMPNKYNIPWSSQNIY